MSSWQWFFILCFAILCWAANNGFKNYVERKFEAETIKAHAATQQKIIEAYEHILGVRQ